MGRKGCEDGVERDGANERMRQRLPALPSPPFTSAATISSLINANTGNLPSTAAASRDTDTQQQTIQPLLLRSQIPEGSVAAWLNHKSEAPPSYPSEAGD